MGNQQASSSVHSKRLNRFIDTGPPADGSSDGLELLAIEKKYSLQDAISLLGKEKKKSVSLQAACTEAENLLAKGEVGKNLGNLSSLDYDSKVVIVAFTLEEPNVYREFNSQSRSLTASSWESFAYKGMWLILNKAILSHGQLSSPLTVYRGISVEIHASPNKTFCFRQIASTSLDKALAQEFSYDKGTLFILKISKGLSIKALSKFPKEDEYIIPALDTFVVKKVETKGGLKIYLEEDK